MAKAQRIEPWWLVETTEICSTCSQSYAYQTEFRCKECDEPICSICIETSEYVCVHCCDEEEI